VSPSKKSQHERAPARTRRGRTDEDQYDDEYDEYDDREDNDQDEYDKQDEYNDYDDYDEQADEENGEEYEEAPEPAPRRPKKKSKTKGTRLSAREAGEAGLRHITAIVTKNVEQVTSVRPADDGWTVEVELLDARHIPSSSDTLALYEIEIDPEGELRSYRRTAQYSRARGREAR
jgi:hypothetical protein